VVSRLRRPDTDRSVGGWELVLGRVLLLEDANFGGPLEVSIVRIFPFEARKFSWRVLCCATQVSSEW
jgi:hypothetical protein